jgi:hypothetical protein
LLLIINPNFTRLIAASRRAPEQEDGALDEAATSHVGLPYALRIPLVLALIRSILTMVSTLLLCLLGSRNQD